MVRLLPLRDDGGPCLSQAVLPELVPTHRHSEFVRHLLHRLRRAAGRGLDLRHLRRSHRPQGDSDRDPPAHGDRDVPHRRHADHLADRSLGGGDPHGPSHGPGTRRRRRVGRLGPDVDGVGQRQAEGLARQLASIWRPGGPADLDPRGRRDQCRDRLQLRGLGLADPVPAQHPAGRRRRLHPAGHPGNPCRSARSWRKGASRRGP